MHRPRFHLIPVLFLVLPLAGAEPYRIDAAHSQVGFKVRYLVGKVAGSFGRFSGTIHFDEKEPSRSRVEVSVEAASINTQNDGRDKHLRTADFFDVEKHPSLGFRSTSVREVAKGKLEVTGDFTLRGVTKRITVPVSMLGSVPNPRTQKLNAAFSAAFTIQRKDFGVNYGLADTANVVVGNEVEIELTLLAERQGGK